MKTIDIHIYLKQFFILSLISGLLAYLYYLIVVIPNATWNIEGFYQNIINGDAESPYNYRILIPYFSLLIHEILLVFINIDFIKSLLVSVFFIFLFSVGAIFLAIKNLKDIAQKKFAIVCSLLLIIVTFPGGGIQLWSYSEIGFFAIAYYFLSRFPNKYLIFFPLAFFAILNRETGIFVCGLPFLLSFYNNKSLNLLEYKKEILLIFFGIVVLFYIREIQGDAIGTISVSEVFMRNISPTNLIQSLALYGSLATLFVGIKKYNLNNIDRAFLLCLLFHSILILIFGIITEIRIFVPYAFFMGILIAKSITEERNMAN